MYEKMTLPNGVRIVYEHMEHVRSAAIGVWVGVGSRYEKASEAGSAHFIEHMLFKGTAQHTAAELAERMDVIGGQVNAYTTREATCFYARVLDTHLDRAADLLSEMFFDSNFSDADAENERGVILEEIDMYEDTPEDLVTERLISAAFPGPLGRPVLGRPATLQRMTGGSLRAFKERHYIAPRIVIAVSGSFTQANIDRIARRFSALEPQPDLTMPGGSYMPALCTKRKAIEQNQITLGFPSIPTGFIDCGMFGVSTAVGRDTEQRALELILEELDKFRESGVTQAELDRAREQVTASVLLAEESTASHMNKLGYSELFLDGAVPAQEILQRYDAVTREDILALARRTLDFGQMSFSAVGRIRPAAEYAQALGMK